MFNGDVNINVNDTVRTKTGKVDYIVKSFDGDVAKLESVDKGTKRSANISTLVHVSAHATVEQIEAVLAPQAVKVSFVRGAFKRIKGKHGGKLRNV